MTDDPRILADAKRLLAGWRKDGDPPPLLYGIPADRFDRDDLVNGLAMMQAICEERLEGTRAAMELFVSRRLDRA